MKKILVLKIIKKDLLENKNEKYNNVLFIFT